MTHAADHPAWLAEALARQLRAWSAAAGAAPDAADAVATLAQRLSLALQDGHVCLPLGDAAAAAGPRATRADPCGRQAGQPPARGGQWAGTLRPALLASGVCGTPAAPGALPLLLDDAGRLYLQRQFDDERRLARRLQRAARVAEDGAAESPAALALLRSLFPADPGAAGSADWQQLAAALALRRRLLLISGGPGTGKTHTVAQLLACLLAARPQLRIALAAPTGKAAARLAQTLAERLAQMAAHGPAALPDSVRTALPRSASTVHRLLGAGPRGFAHDARNPLPIDLLVVDEASMLDLALAVRLLEAVPDDARIVLLGDKDQLAAVEAGCVFAEAAADPALGSATRSALAAMTGTDPAAIVPAPADEAGERVLADSCVWLSRGRRFGAESGIGRLAAAVRSGDAATALQLLRAGGDLRWLTPDGAPRPDPPAAGADAPALPAAPPDADVPAPAAAAGTTLDASTLAAIEAGFEPYLRALLRDPADAAGAAAAFARFGVLGAVHAGPRGVAAVNRRVEALLRTRLASLHAALGADPASPWVVGRAVMVLRNDPLLRLANGDVGFVLAGADGRPQLHFDDGTGGWRALAPHRLPPCTSAFATTVHKAQGSQWDAVLLVLPDRAGRGLVRELLYTAVTRARRRLTLSGSAAVIASAIDTRSQRASGLRDRLREAAAA